MITNLAADTQVFTSNAFLVDGERPVLIDTGANFDIIKLIESGDITPEAIILTHTHPDHIGNIPALTDAFDLDVYGFDTNHSVVDHEIEDEQTVTIGNDEYTALYTPGHCEDHICFYAPDPAILFAGDLIFQNGGVGRTDLPGGNNSALKSSIQRVLSTVSPSLTAIHAGHGPSVTDNAYRHVELADQLAKSL